MSAAALVLSVSLHRFVAHQREQPSPWLALGGFAFGLAVLPVGLVAWNLVDTQLVVRGEEQRCALAAQMLTRFAPDFDFKALEPNA